MKFISGHSNNSCFLRLQCWDYKETYFSCYCLYSIEVWFGNFSGFYTYENLDLLSILYKDSDNKLVFKKLTLSTTKPMEY